MNKIKNGNYYKRISDGKIFKVHYIGIAIISLIEARTVEPFLSMMAVAVPFDSFLKEFTEPTELERALL